MSELKDLTVEEISIVDAGANPEAKIILTKRAGDSEALIERLTKRLRDMEAQLEQSEMLKVASKYELLGEDSKVLAQTLKQAKAAGTYDTIIKLLDSTLELTLKAGTFKELGKTGTRSAGTVEEVAKAIQKRRPDLTWRQALDKAYQQLGVIE